MLKAMFMYDIINIFYHIKIILFYFIFNFLNNINIKYVKYHYHFFKLSL